MISNTSVQDRDLLGRLNQYFATIELRLREGQGWLIFNADRRRRARIVQFISDRLNEYRPLLSFYIMPWRDLALNAYLVQVELIDKRLQEAPEEQPMQREYRLADRISQDIHYHMLYCDLLILNGVSPTHPYEVGFLDAVLEQRHTRRRATIVITPATPHGLAVQLCELQSDESFFDRFLHRMYETSLIAF